MGTLFFGKGLVSLSCSSPPWLQPGGLLFVRRPSSASFLLVVPASKFNQRIPMSASLPLLYSTLLVSNYRRALRRVVCLGGINSAENYEPDESTSPSKEAAIDLQLPRRNLMVQFTCDACGERTHRVINRVAYERGTVFLQCAGCLVYHKFVDNLGLVVEYDLREEIIEDSSGTE